VAIPDRTPPDLSRLVRQHAETSRLLGVDFVPRFRAPASTNEADAPPIELPGSDVPVSRTSSAAPSRVAPEIHATHSAVVAPAAAHSPATRPPERPTVIERGPLGPTTRDHARSQQRLDELRAKYEAEAPHQHFNMNFTKVVWGDGDPCARLMFVGEAPGADEDRTGIPFVGRAGELLNKMIIAMGLRREDVYIANVLKTRPPDNATPTPKEVELCAPYLRGQIAVVAPEVIVTLGLPASRCILNSAATMGQLRGIWAAFTADDGREIPVMPTYHPAFLLRSYSPENRAKVWSDLQLAMQRLGMQTPGKSAPSKN